jgi:Flp pilus assembly protein protease CpaA
MIYEQILLIIVLTILGYIYTRKNNIIGDKFRCILFLMLLTVISSYVFLTMNKIGFNNYTVSFIIALYIITLMSIQDIMRREIPIDLVVLSFVVGIVLLYFNPNGKVIEGIVSSVIFGGVMLALAKITRGGIGEGDALIFAMITLFLTWKIALAVIFYTFLISGLVSIILLVFKKVNRKTQLPLAPFILISIILLII